MYVVTGASGNTGSVIVNGLLAKGERVRAIARHADRLKPLVAKGAEAFAADLSDSGALARAFAGAKGAYVMIPPDVSNEDIPAYQANLTETIATALEQSRIQHAVLLSSIGADKPEKTGPVAGLHRFEERLNRIAGLNVLHVRAGYFMENTLMQTGIIKAAGMCAGPMRGDLKVPMIATEDVGKFVTERLLKLDFKGHEARELLGERDISMDEVASIIGKAIGKADLKYVQLPDDQLSAAMLQMGLSASAVSALLEMAAALNSGYMRALETRSAKNTTSTSYEAFVKEEFLPAYQGAVAA